MRSKPTSTAPKSAPAPSSERGGRALLVLVLIALVVGGIVVAYHPGYRAAFLSLLRGSDSSESPISRSNAAYYERL